MFKIGCHVSCAGGVWCAPERASKLGCEVFQMFTRSPQGGSVPKIDSAVIENFKSEMVKYKFSEFVVHCPYFINFGSINPRIYHGSSAVVRQELERTSMLGGSYVMCHLGSFKDIGQEKGMEQVQNGLIKVLEGYEGPTKLLLEIAAGAGEIIGDTFEELAEIMEPLTKYKTFGGICFDTQHAFASGYDIRTKETVLDTFKKFDKAIGLKYLKMSHINDSKIPLAGRKDRHEHIGEGEIGEKGFGFLLEYLNSKFKILNSSPTTPFPLIFETEHDKVELDITILKSLRNKLKK